MKIIRKYRPGEMCWTDLGTPDFAGAKKFYRAIFGWTAKDLPMGPGFDYAMMRVKGKKVCVLYGMPEDQRAAKVTPLWLPYVSVANVAATVKKARAAGGKIIVQPRDVKEGSMAVIKDPAGAAIGLWQAGSHAGATISKTPGAVCWHDLNTPKAGIAAKFYAKVFGWKWSAKDVSGKKYTTFQLGKQSACGMWPIPMKGLPPSWVTHWQVTDCAKLVTKVKRLGGRVVMGATAVPGVCRFAILKDPKGAVFGILEPVP
ncbi:MAG TPA: VOC family protein [Candidatus Eremiobacteraceae bacterium]|nr:VOC family protein [Candidatus Eremiobacteraceae bacterium]